MLRSEVTAAVKLFGSYRAAAQKLGVGQTSLRTIATGGKVTRKTAARLESGYHSLKRSDRTNVKKGGDMLRKTSPDEMKRIAKSRDPGLKGDSFKKMVNKWHRGERTRQEMRDLAEALNIDLDLDEEDNPYL